MAQARFSPAAPPARQMSTPARVALHRVSGPLIAPTRLSRSDESTFYIYYAASQFGSENSGIFLVSSTNGLTGWLDHGLVQDFLHHELGLQRNRPLSGSWYLSLGSWWSGIKLFSLSSSTGKPTGGYYYLFTSFDICCDGTASTYNIRVTRSTSLKGPYVDESGVAALSGGGTEILGTHDYVYGPGGQSLLLDGDEVVLVYHYYSATTSILGINLLDFSTGWPVVY
ncbi:hypothetical protein HWV62_29398 [Athelia sp. TMB]|nr:hypothetical protein HWV62_29398 [Athelia sp. TMB]